MSEKFDVKIREGKIKGKERRIKEEVRVELGREKREIRGRKKKPKK